MESQTQRFERFLAQWTEAFGLTQYRCFVQTDDCREDNTEPVYVKGPKSGIANVYVVTDRMAVLDDAETNRRAFEVAAALLTGQNHGDHHHTWNRLWRFTQTMLEMGRKAGVQEMAHREMAEQAAAKSAPVPPQEM